MNVTTNNNLTWRYPILLPAGWYLQVADLTGQLTATDSRHVLRRSNLYVISGYDHASHLWTAYVGLTAAINPGRPWVSYAKWTATIRAFQAQHVGLLTAERTPTDDELRILEARLIMNLSGAGVRMLNSQSSAPTATARLGRRGPTVAALGDQLASHVHAHVLAGHTNPLSTPAGSLREAAVRVVLNADRALRTDEVAARLAALNIHYTGQTPDYTIRRDLRIREAETAGHPRVLTTSHHGRTLYYRHTLPQAIAVARYEAAHHQGHHRLTGAQRS